MTKRLCGCSAIETCQYVITARKRKKRSATILLKKEGKILPNPRIPLRNGILLGRRRLPWPAFQTDLIFMAKTLHRRHGFTGTLVLPRPIPLNYHTHKVCELDALQQICNWPLALRCPIFLQLHRSTSILPTGAPRYLSPIIRAEGKTNAPSWCLGIILYLPLSLSLSFEA